MRTKKIILFTFLSLLLASSCMPDSFTKFEEDEPSSTTVQSSGGSTDDVDDEDFSYFEAFYYPQSYDSNTPSNSDKLILEVSDVNPFKVGDTLSNNGNMNAVITYINENEDRIFVQITSQVTDVSKQFKIGDDIDKTPIYVTSRATISDIIHIFDASDLSLSKTPVLYDSIDSTESLNSSNRESLVWSITPNLPKGLSLKSDGTISVDLTISPTPTSLTVLTETEFRIEAKSAIGEDVQIDYKFSLVKPPSLASVARYQIIRLSSNASRFFRGSRISGNPVDTEEAVAPSGRVLMTLDTDNNGVIDSLLIEGNGHFPHNMGVDNTPSFFANEGTVVPYIFLYVKDSSDFNTESLITSSDGATAEIIDISDDVLFVKVNSGIFNTGDSISGDASTTIDNIQGSQYITTIFELASAPVDFTIGEEFFGNSTSDKGIVIAKDGNYLFVRHIEGVFSQGDNLTDSDGAIVTIAKIVGPNIEINTSSTGANVTNSSGTYAGPEGLAEDEDFYEGQAITCYSSSSAYETSGFAVYGTDYLNNKVTMQVENFESHCSEGTDYFIDDISSNSVASNGLGVDDASDIVSIESSNLVIGYVSDLLYLDIFVRGEVSSATLSPEKLPDGLNFDEETGIISGTPTSPLTGEEYTITLRSSDGQEVSYSFALVIYNQFEISQKTDNASSYLMHKEGRGFAASYCRIISPQIIDDIPDSRYNKDIYGFNDIICRLEAGEGDLYNNGIEFEITAGAGMCEYVSYTPYSYRPFLVGETEREIVRYDNFAEASSCGTGESGGGTATTGGSAITSGYINQAQLEGTNHLPFANRTFGEEYCHDGDCVVDAATTDQCKYNYSLYDEDWPNLDEGSVSVVDVSCSFSETVVEDDTLPDEVSTHCECSYTKVVTDCGGDVDLNISGSKLSSSLASDEHSYIISSFSGIIETEIVESPISLNKDNRYLANFLSLEDYSTGNSCYANEYHMEQYSSVDGSLSTNRSSWRNYSANTSDPLGGSAERNPLSKFYTFKCLDAAYDTKSQITVQVRDWDREFSPEDSELESLHKSDKMDSYSFDNIYDLGSFWKWTVPTETTPLYETCGDETETLSASLGTIVITVGESLATVSGISSDESFPAGAIIELSSGERFLVASNVTSNGSVWLATTPESSYSTTFQVVRKIPFPLQ